MAISLYKFGDKIEFSEIDFNQVIGDIDSINFTLHNTKIDVMDKLTLIKDDDEIFSGIVVNINKDTSGDITILAYEDAWNLKRFVPNLTSYTNWKLDNIFRGISKSKINNISKDSLYLEVSWTSSKDTGKKIILTGLIGQGRIKEEIPLDETNNRKINRSKWDLTKIPFTITDLLSIHLEDDNNNMISPNGVISIKDSTGSNIVSINTDNYIAAVQDEKGYYANGILFNTGLDLELDLDEIIIENAKYTISGENILEILRDLSSTSPDIWGNNMELLLNFKLEDNILKIQKYNDEISYVFREDKEIISANYSESIENITNFITINGDDSLILIKNDDSINKYGVFEYSDDTNLSNSGANFYALNLLKNKSSISSELNCDLLGILPKIGYTARIIIPSLGIDKEYTIQEISSRIGALGIGITSLTLSDKKITRRWKIPFRMIDDFIKSKVIIRDTRY